MFIISFTDVSQKLVCRVYVRGTLVYRSPAISENSLFREEFRGGGKVNKEDRTMNTNVIDIRISALFTVYATVME